MVATKVACVPELIVNDIDGIVINPNKHQEITKGVIDLLSNPNKARQIAENAFEKVKNFSVNKEIATMEKIYIELLKKNDIRFS